jgi:3-dehydroquinate synthase
MNILPVEFPRFIPNQHELWISTDILEYSRIIKANFNASSWWVITDSQVHQECYPRFAEAFKLEHEVIILPEGEESKSLKSCEMIWNKMESAQADRNAVVIALGGGMITDLAGFAASCWKRGIRFLFIPTSLLAMVDAAIGGKTGIDLSFGKNLLGLFSLPSLVVSDTTWLQTLSPRELKSGFAECLKHGLVAEETYWKRISSRSFEGQEWEFVVYRSQLIKAEIVKTDPDEQWMRKILNFGHTLGHALESLCLELEISLLHGEAIAWGMQLEAALSKQFSTLSQFHYEEIVATLTSLHYPIPSLDFSNPEIENKFIYYLRNDKKNQGNEIRLSLLSRIGHCNYDIAVPESAILQVIRQYFSPDNA